MNKLIEYIKEAESKHIAIGHFNFCELTVFNAIIEAAKELNAPVILGTSEKERNFLGEEFLKDVIARSGNNEAISQVSPGETGGIASVASLPRNDGGGRKIFFNSDHTKSLEGVKKAVELGYDAILFDGSDLPLEENIQRAKEVVEYVRNYETQSPDHPKILVEGEIGFIGSGSQLRESAPEGIQLTSVEDAARFVGETGVDMLAPAVGNIHGIIMRTNADGTRTYAEPALNINRIKEIKEALRQAQGKPFPLVLHGASGNSDEDIRAAIKAGINIVHINTEIRLAWRKALEESLPKNSEELAPYKILAASQKAAEEAIKQKLKLFSGL